MEFHLLDPILEYQQNDSSSFYSCLAYALSASGRLFSARDIVVIIQESWNRHSKGYSNEIKFANSIIIDKEQNKGYQLVYYNIRTFKVKSRFDIMNDISENVTLVKLVETFGNVNHAVSIVVYYIFYSNYIKYFRWQNSHWVSYALLWK